MSLEVVVQMCQGFLGWRLARVRPTSTETGAAMVEYAAMGSFLALLTVLMLMLVGNAVDSQVGTYVQLVSELDGEMRALDIDLPTP